MRKLLSEILLDAYPLCQFLKGPRSRNTAAHTKYIDIDIHRQGQKLLNTNSVKTHRRVVLLASIPNSYFILQKLFNLRKFYLTLSNHPPPLSLSFLLKGLHIINIKNIYVHAFLRIYRTYVWQNIAYSNNVQEKFIVYIEEIKRLFL